MSDITVRRISFGSSEYDQELALRDLVLRKPLGLDISEGLSDTEAADIHLGAFDGDDLAGVLMLIDTGGGVAKMRQVAVAPDRRRQGIGRLLVAEAEKSARGFGFNRIILNARKTAIPFYLAMDYVVISSEFLEIGIPHMKMEKWLLRPFFTRPQT